MHYGHWAASCFIAACITQFAVVSHDVHESPSSSALGVGPTFRFRDRPHMVPLMNILHTKLYVEAVDALVDAFAKKMLKQTTRSSRLDYTHCIHLVTEVAEKAKCLREVLDQHEETAKLNKISYLFQEHWRRTRMRMKRSAVSNQKAARSGYTFGTAYKHGFLTGALTEYSEQRRSPPVPSPVQALSTLVENAFRNNEQFDRRDKSETTFSKLKLLQNIAPTQFAMQQNSFTFDNIAGRRIGRELTTIKNPSSPFNSLPKLTNRKTSKISPMKMYRLPSLGEVSPLTSLIGQPTAWAVNGKFSEAFSPRIAPIIPKKSKEERRILSPTILSFYREPSADNIASLPEIMDKAGVSSDDQEALINMMLEVSGASNTIHKIYDSINQKSTESDPFDMDRQIADATQHIEKVWKEVFATFSFQQHIDFENDGYTFLRRDQLEKLYGENGLYRQSAKLNIDLDKYEKWTDHDREKFLKTAIRKLASNGNSNYGKHHMHTKGKGDLNNLPKIQTSQRKKRQSSFYPMRQRTFRNTTTTNYWEKQRNGEKIVVRRTFKDLQFNMNRTRLLNMGNKEMGKESGSRNVSGIDMNGENENEVMDKKDKSDEKKEEEDEEEEHEGQDTTLEPFAFIVSNLQPSLLGPVTLSPNIFSPSNLSPALLGPTILSPSLGNPIILSPYVLSPVILSPNVLAPGVLSPYVLSPNIINFVVLCPNILSPYVLSPDILSPSLFSPNIFSPYVLSPAIFSDDIFKNDTFDGSPDIFSPSLLSK